VAFQPIARADADKFVKTYALYLESGPRKQKTMVHVVELLGCVAKGPTTDDALAATPDAIRAYLHFLTRHGEPVDPRAEFRTKIAEHVTKGQWLGNGDPALAFAFDRKPLTPKDVAAYVRRLEWSRAEVRQLIDGLTPRQLDAEPTKEKGRSIRAMLEHMLESEYFYLSSALGKVEGLPAAGSIVKKGGGDVLAWMGQVRRVEIERMRALTPTERSRSVEHWRQTWTARKALRRMLEHEWEHLVELSERLGEPL
jgi:uncharacterized damage-inducible protein DinB/predicted RNase H-like HicB family nuclease